MLAFARRQWLHGKPLLPVVLTGVGGGHDIDLRHFAAKGVRLAGYLSAVRGEKLGFADNVEEILSAADDAYVEFCAAVDAHLQRTGAAAEPLGDPVPPPHR